MWRKLSERTEGSAQMIGAVIALLVAIIVGVLIWYKINSAVFQSSRFAYGTGPHVAFNATWNNSNATANTIWTLFPIVAIVIIAGIILAIVMNFGRGQGA